MAAGFALLTIKWRSVVLIAIAVLFAIAAIVVPRVLSGIYRVWMRVGEALAWINTRIILTLIFFLVVTPTGLLMRLFGRSPIDPRRRFAASYWDDVDVADRHMEKQF
jgi:hypothetical protein